jgi:hypothetical protein
MPGPFDDLNDPYRRKGVEYEEDADMQRWAEEKGKLAKRGGATTFKIPDGKGGFSYTLRNADQYSGPGAPGTQVTLDDADGRQVLAESMGQSKVHKPRLTKSQAQSFKGDYETYKKKQETAADELKLEKQRAADRAQAREDYAFKLQQDRENEKLRRQDQLATPLASERVQNAQAGLVEGQAELAKGSFTRKSDAQKKAADTAELAMKGADVPEYSKNAEAAIRKSYAEGMEPMEAVAAGRSVHDADAKRIWELEASGIPANIREAQRLRAGDPDLAAIESRLPVRDMEAERRSIGSAADSFLSVLGKKAREEDKSWFNISGDKYDDYADFSSEEQQDIRASLADSIEELRSRNPMALRSEDKGAIKAAFNKRMQEQGFPLSHIDAIMNALEDII